MEDVKRYEKYTSRFYHCITKSEVFEIVTEAVEDEYITASDFLVIVSVAQKHLELIALIDINK